MLDVEFSEGPPKYRQLADHLRAMLRDGRYAPGDRVPSENSLVEQLQISRSTVRRALDLLREAGSITTRQGQGSFFQLAGAGRVATGLIALVLPSMRYTIYPRIIEGVEAIAHDHRCSVIVGNTEGDSAKELAILRQVLSRDLDGLIIEPTHSATVSPDAAMIKLLERAAIPVVVVNDRIPLATASFVGLDDAEAGRRAASYLIDKGHTRIGYVYKESIRAAQDRKRGYLAALAARNIVPDDRYLFAFHEADEPSRPGALAVRQLLSLGVDRPSAVFFYNDECALHGIDALREVGLDAPQDMSVVGFDDIEASAAADLTTFAHPQRSLGTWAAQFLFERLAQRGEPAAKSMLFHPELVARRSVRSLL